ncbi:MAG: type II toxin-antitoxin system RelE/ParE family toxin [Elusimicrobia bacterium]|nr:type II toxin-antitoxin system RelE/ParE family toxin [Elusimicrobiota bacterium]
MDIVPLTVRYYHTSTGRCPFEEWLYSLDPSIQNRVNARVARISRGLLGYAEQLGGGVHELKLDLGPGYRIYFGRSGNTVVILLNAGHKKTQSIDVATAHDFWADYLRRWVE